MNSMRERALARVSACESGRACVARVVMQLGDLDLHLVDAVHYALRTARTRTRYLSKQSALLAVYLQRLRKIEFLKSAR